MPDGTFPSSPPPPPPVSPIVSTGRSWWQSWWLITGLSVVLIVGAAALIASNTGDDAQSPPATADDVPPVTDPPDEPPPTAASTSDDPSTPITPAPTAAPTSTDPASTDAPATTAAPPATDQADEIDGAPAGSIGDRLEPVAPGEIADIGDGWRLQVLGITEEGTDVVLAENQFNDPPRAGTKYTLVEIALGYYGLDDPANAFVPTIAGVASASVELDEDCGVIPNDFRTFADVFSGGVLQGQVCFVTTPADDGTIQLYATTGFAGPDVFLATSASAASPQPLPTLAGPQPGAKATPARLDPNAIGVPVDVGEGWTLTVTAPAADITDAVAAENQFNDPPPDGFGFVGVGVDFRYDGDGAASAFEVGTKMVGDSNVEVASGCGVIRDPVDTFADVFAGGSVAGNLCFVVPTDEIGTLVLYAATGFGEEPVFFSTGGGNPVG